MASESVESEFRKSVAAQIRLVAEGANRYRLSTPFIFDDGDHPIIILKREDAKWVLSDEGHTRMHFGDDLEAEDPDRGIRRSLALNALARFRIEDRDGELVLDVSDGRFGEALYAFAQGLLSMSTIASLNRAREADEPGTDDRAGKEH